MTARTRPKPVRSQEPDYSAPYSSHLSHKFALIKWRKQECLFSSHDIGGQKGSWPQLCLPGTQAPVLKGIQHSSPPQSLPACGMGCQGAEGGGKGWASPVDFPSCSHPTLKLSIPTTTMYPSPRLISGLSVSSSPSSLQPSPSLYALHPTSSRMDHTREKKEE